MPDIYKQTSLEDIILTAFAVVVIIILIGCLYSFFRAIFFFIFSGGKEDQKKKGWNSIRFMIIGLLIFTVLLISFPYALKAMNIELSEDYSAKRVFSRAGELFQKVFKVGTMIKDAQKENEFRGNMYYDINSTSSDVNNAGYSL